MKQPKYNVGNKVHYCGTEVTVTGVTEDKLTLKYFEDSVGFDRLKNDPDISPIPINKDNLKELGFEESYSSRSRLVFDHKIAGEIGYDFSRTDEKCNEGFKYFGKVIKADYVHEVQNLLDALKVEDDEETT